MKTYVAYYYKVGKIPGKSLGEAVAEAELYAQRHDLGVASVIGFEALQGIHTKSIKEDYAASDKGYQAGTGQGKEGKETHPECPSGPLFSGC